MRCQSETKFFAENGFHGVCQRTDFSMILNFWHPKPNTRIYNFRHGAWRGGTRNAPRSGSDGHFKCLFVLRIITRAAIVQNGVAAALRGAARRVLSVKC